MKRNNPYILNYFKRDKFEQLGMFTILLIFLTSMFRLYLFSKRSALPGFGDHIWIWTECRIAWYGVSPYKALQDNLVVNGLSTFSHVSTLPWGLTLGTLIHGAFLPQELSIIWYLSINVIAFLFMVICLNRKMSELGWEPIRIFEVDLLMVSSWYIIDALNFFNNGMLTIIFIVTAICIIEKHEWTAGIFMLFTMIKPQNAIPFFITFLFLKKWKTIFVSVVGVIAGWIISAFWTSTNPIAQLSGVISFASNPESGFHYVGALDFLRHFGVSSMIALLLSMAFGVALLTVTLVYLRRIQCHNIWILYGVTAIVSTLWCYKSLCDYLMLLLPAIALLELSYSHKNKIEWFVFFGALVLLLTKPFSTALLGRLPFLSEYMCNRLDLYSKSLTLIPILYGASKND